MTETDPAQRFALGTRSTLKAIIFFGPVSHQSFDHRLGEAWNYHSPTHPPQHFGGVSSPPFPCPPWPLFMGPSLHHIPTGLLHPILCPALLIGDRYETKYVPSLHFCFTALASGISSTSHTRMISHKRRGVCRYAIIVSAVRSHNPQWLSLPLSTFHTTHKTGRKRSSR